MAKGAFLGVKRGKLGDAVGYNVSNSADGVKQGWRIYQPVVSNPQTDAQINQRIKLTAANNLYHALKLIIQRGWENKKYGDESRRAFLKRALGGAFAGPYLPKGSTLAVPIEGAPITYGSLTPVAVECASAVGGAILTNVPTYDGADPSTIGGLSALFINANLALPGDQITFVLASLNGAGTVSYLRRSFYVDANNIERVTDVLFYIGAIDYEGVSVLLCNFASVQGFSHTHFAALVSISRDGANSNLRSYAEFDMTSEFRSTFYGSAAQIEAAKASYRKKQAASTNWPLDPGTGGETVVQSAFTRAGVEFTPVSLSRKDSGDIRFEVIVDDGGNQYYIGSRPSAASSNIVYLAGTASTAAADPTDLTTANSVNVFDSANTAAGLRAWLISQGVSANVLPV